MADLRGVSLGFVWSTAAAAIVLLTIVAPVANAGSVQFNRDVRPILKEHCFRCHGPDASARKSDLRSERRDGATQPARSGDIAVAPGKPDQSELIVRITSADKDDMMPPEKSGQRLSSAEVETLRKWVLEGAPYEKHWAFEKPLNPAIPAVKDLGWPRQPFDFLVLADLEKTGLAPSPAADRTTLLRRISLDLTGVPPSAEEAAAFLHDGTPGAYERLVDRLLGAPAFGENWARVWLDLARYADSRGYQPDRRRDMWRYRDWVIAALNADMPFDQFTKEQLAGDLLPRPTEAQLIATAFHRNSMLNEEAGIDPEEFRAEAVRDRVETTFEVWMGLTMGCAKCHSHKYDPISQKEYYQIYAFFNQTADTAGNGDAPTLSSPLLEDPIHAKKAVAAGIQSLRRTTETPIMRELPVNQRRESHLFKRGNFRDPGEVVEPEVPAAFPPFPEDAPKNRLGLAEWLCSRENPLTARVQVNRVWARLFGRGLVETEEDFGTQGTPPDHPELLDYLAVGLMDGGWSLKRLIRTIVLSATYQQSSRISPELLERDPQNRLLARGPRFRLEAEMIRDQALAASGLLSPKMYGPPVMPYQPPGMLTKPYDRAGWETSPGEDRHRRAIYTLLKRTIPYPELTIFDGQGRESCVIRRIRTNTPLQALEALDDPVFVECAQALARKMEAAAEQGVEARIATGFHAVLLRDPFPAEIEALKELYRKRLDAFQHNPAAAAAFATDPLGPLPAKANAAELAALTAVANVLLNLDEFLTKN